MSAEESHFDPVRSLTEHAGHLNAIRWGWIWPIAFYDLMSGAVVFRDETNRKTTVHVIWALRYIVAYRTSLMIGKPREELKPMWDLGLSLFPKWVGFRPARRTATPKLLEIYRRGTITTKKCIRDLEREVDKPKS